jgi:catechol 2,3-dioxygenase-like lactoylglutathione lyase family enzyme
MRRFATLPALALGLLATLPVLAAEPVTSGKFIKYVQTIADMDRSYAFYNALGLEADGAAAPGKKLASNAMVVRLTGSPEGLTFRNAFLKVPGTAFQFEFTEFGSAAQQPVFPRTQDPGASVLVLRVRNIDAALAAAKSVGAKVVTLGGKPLKSGTDGARAIAVRDPEGYYVEFQEVVAPPADAPAGNIIGGRFASIVADAEKAAAFYHAQFGLEVRSEPPSRERALLHVLGVARGEVHRTLVTTPGNPVELRFLSVSGVEQKAYAPHIIDPGAPAYGFVVADLDAAVAAYTAAGGVVLTTDGPIRRPNGSAVAFVRDPFGLPVELQQPAPPAAH